MKKVVLLGLVFVVSATSFSSAQIFRRFRRNTQCCTTQQNCNSCNSNVEQVSYVTPADSSIVNDDASVVQPISSVDNGSTIISSGDSYTATSNDNAVVSYSASPAISQSSSYVPSSATTSYSMPNTYSNDVSSMLAVVNQKRRQAGLYELQMDPSLTSTAQRKASYRASRRMTGHDGSSRGYARVEGVGYSYGSNPSSAFNTCYLYSTGYRYAGAAMARDSSGRTYYTLLLR